MFQSTDPNRSSNRGRRSARIGLAHNVNIFHTVDAGGSSFSIFIPPVTLPSETTTTRVHTYGITTFHRFSIFPDSPLFAQKKIQKIDYGATELNGTASFLNFW